MLKKIITVEIRKIRRKGREIWNKIVNAIQRDKEKKWIVKNVISICCNNIITLAKNRSNKWSQPAQKFSTITNVKYLQL